jgi:hypothetical protein
VIPRNAPTLFRILDGPDPREADFLSQAMEYLEDIRAGRIPRKPIPDDGEWLHMWAGVSMYGDIDRAASIARRYPKMGRHLARILVTDEDLNAGTIRLELTGSNHFTVWGRPADPLGCIQLPVIEISRQ